MAYTYNFKYISELPKCKQSQSVAILKNYFLANSEGWTNLTLVDPPDFVFGVGGGGETNY